MLLSSSSSAADWALLLMGARGQGKCVLVHTEVGGGPEGPDRCLVGTSAPSSYQPAAVLGWSPDLSEVL